MDLRTANVTRYILPLREGGSLPALAEADDEFKYVVKFRGAGHGTKALIAELIGGEIARTLGFRVPEIIFLNLDEAFGRTEADEEIQDLLQWSRGLNIGLHFLSGALTFDPVVHQVDGKTASQIVWMDGPGVSFLQHDGIHALQGGAVQQVVYLSFKDNARSLRLRAQVIAAIFGQLDIVGGLSHADAFPVPDDSEHFAPPKKIA